VNKVVVIIILLVGSIIVDFSLQLSIENSKRQQARYNLEEMKKCMSCTTKHTSIDKALEACASKSRTTFTGDAYVLDAYTLEFLYDASNDTDNKVQKLYFTERSISKYFNDWKSAESFISVVTLGKDSTAETRKSYLFDDSTEWLEWKYFPSDLTSNFGEKKMILVQGIQSDEALAEYVVVRWVIRIITLLSVIVLLALRKTHICPIKV